MTCPFYRVECDTIKAIRAWEERWGHHIKNRFMRDALTKALEGIND